MSATLGALVIAISTEFSVLLSERFRPGAASGAATRRTRWRGPTGSPDRRCSPPGSPRSPGSVCSRYRASRCCATSGWSRWSTCRCRSAGVLLVLPSVLALSERRDALGSASASFRGASPAGSPAGGGPAWREQPPRRGRGPAGARAPDSVQSPHRQPPLRAGWSACWRRVLVVGFLGLRVDQSSVGRRNARGRRRASRCAIFAAPLAASDLNGDANLSPPCTLAHHDPRALNVCLLAERGPLVLALLRDRLVGVRARGGHDAGACRRAPGTRGGAVRGGRGQRAATRPPPRPCAGTAWTIPVAYDADGGGGRPVRRHRLSAARARRIVAERWRPALIGEHWIGRAALARAGPGAAASGVTVGDELG